MYVDESGDIGLNNSPSRYFILTGLVIHELRWKVYLDELIAFRKRMRNSFGLLLREEIHASHFLARPKKLIRIKRNDRLTILRLFSNTLAMMTDLNIINIVVDKQNKHSNFNVFEVAWRNLIQRFENTISYRNFPGPHNSDERGLILPDHTDDKKLTKLLRKLRRYNPVPNTQDYGTGFRNLPLCYIIEDPQFHDSSQSYFIQAVDLIAYLLNQKLAPNLYMRKNSGYNYFLRLDPILCKVASNQDPYGIVWI